MDSEQQAVAALDALRLEAGAVGAAPVLFYGFDDLTPLQLDAIETLGFCARGGGDGVALTYESPVRCARASGS